MAVNPPASVVVRVAVYPVGVPGRVVYGITVPAGHPVQDLSAAVRILRAAADQLEASPGSGVGLHREGLTTWE